MNCYFFVFYRPLPKHYHADLFQLQSEIEDGRTPDNTSVRFRYSEQEFPGYSWRGYGVFSDVQVIYASHRLLNISCVVSPVTRSRS